MNTKLSMFLFLLIPSAQADELDVNAQLFRPAIDSRYFLWINETGLAEDNALHFKGVFSYSSRPLVYTGYDGTQIDFLHSVSQLDLLGRYVYGDVRFGVNLPLYAYIEGETPTGENISQSAIPTSKQTMHPNSLRVLRVFSIWSLPYVRCLRHLH